MFLLPRRVFPSRFPSSPGKKKIAMLGHYADVCFLFLFYERVIQIFGYSGGLTSIFMPETLTLPGAGSRVCLETTIVSSFINISAVPFCIILIDDLGCRAFSPFIFPYFLLHSYPLMGSPSLADTETPSGAAMVELSYDPLPR